MKVLARKTKQFSALVLRFIVGALMMTAVIVVLPIYLLINDPSFFTNLEFMSIIIGIMGAVALVGYFLFIRPYMIYRKMPEIQAETDGEYLYIHSKKEAKIAFADMDGTYFDCDVPNLVSGAREIAIHMLSERYGHVIIDTPNHGKFKLYFVANAEDVMYELADLTNQKLNEEN
jgi:hypothetical protein